MLHGSPCGDTARGDKNNKYGGVEMFQNLQSFQSWAPWSVSDKPDSSPRGVVSFTSALWAREPPAPPQVLEGSTHRPRRRYPAVHRSSSLCQGSCWDPIYTQYGVHRDGDAVGRGLNPHFTEKEASAFSRVVSYSLPSGYRLMDLPRSRTGVWGRWSCQHRPATGLVHRVVLPPLRDPAKDDQMRVGCPAPKWPPQRARKRALLWAEPLGFKDGSLVGR